MPKLSPLRMFSSKPEATENEAAAAATRLPFCPIQETSGFDPTPRGSRGSKAQVPLLEKNVAPDMTPEKRSLALKSKFLWYQHQQVRNHPPCDLSQDDAGSDTSEIMEHNTPSRSVRHHHSLQQVVKHGGASQFSTPRASKIENKYLNLHSEPGNNTLQPSTGTPKKSVSRSLKYNQDMSVRVAAAKLSHGKHGDAEFDLEEDASFWQDHNVQVLVRIRPPSSTEGPSRCLRQDTPHSVTWAGHPESRFTFDHVACETISQEKLFKVAGLPMVENCISGYNNCIFAYGQTGSGKTHTMLGDIADLDQEQTEGRGMIPRVFEYLFVKIQLEEEARRTERLEFVCKCSFLEIYNEQISDLLEPSSTNLQLREDAKKGVYVENLTEVEVRSVKDVVKLLLQGSANRKVAATNMNRESSRSHSVFTCVVESKWESDSIINTRFGRLNLVDLAGSERQKSSGAEGDRLKEAANINKSLSTLGLVIMVLVDAANGKPRHVPYRDSKLTFLLQDSLGGNSKTLIIATVSPSSSCSLETLSTLKFAQRAKFIRNNPIVNEDTFGDLVSLRQQIQQLKEELTRVQSQERKQGEDDDTNMGPVAQDVLAASLRREAVAESVIKSLGSEIGHLKRLVRQREEDTQRVKMLLRFREDKIRRMEAASRGGLGADDYASEERTALQDEVKLLANRIEHNPEVTRFAMENIRLVEELKRYQEFYDHGEREAMCVEISSLRDQLVEVLEANKRLKECAVPSHSELELQNEKLRLEACTFQRSIEDFDHRLHVLQDANDKLIRQNQDLQQQLSVLSETNDGLRQELELTKARVEDLKVDEQAHLTTISGLKLLLQQSEEKKAVEVQIQGNSADASHVQQVGIVEDPLQSLQLELRKKNEVDYLEKQLKSAAENSDEAQKMKVEQELLRTRQELETAQELNRVFYREKVRRLSLERRMEAIRAEAESETADALASMHRDLAMTSEMLILATEHEREATENVARLAYEVTSLQLENSRLVDICNSGDKENVCESEEVHKLWQQATCRLVDCLSEGDETLNAAAREMENILRVHLMDPLSNRAAIELLTKQKATEELQFKLQQAFGIVKDAEEKMRTLNEATFALTELQKRQKAETERQIQDANSRVDAATRTISEQQITISTLQGRSLADLELLEETQASLQAAQKELTEQEKRNSICVVRLAELTEELEEIKNCSRTKEEQLLGDVEALKDKLDRVVAEYALTCSSLFDHIIILEHEARSFKDSLEHTLWTCSCDTSAVLDELKGGIMGVKNLTSGFMEDVSESNTRLQVLSRSLEASEHNLTSAEARFQHFAERASSAERELSSRRAELDTALATQATYASDIAVTKQQFETFKEVADSERQNLQLTIADTQERLSSAERKAAEWQLELDRNHEKYELVKKECMTAVAEMNELDIKVQQLDEHIGLLEEENSVLKRESITAKAIIDALKAEADAAQIELQNKVDSLLEEIRRKDECHQASQHSFQELVSATAKLQDHAEEKISSLHWKIDMKEKQVHEELSRLHNILGAMNSDVTAIEASLLEENALLKSNIQFIESERKTQRNMIENLNQEESDLREEIEHQKVVIYNMKREAQHSTEEQAALEDKVASLLKEIEKKEDVVKGLEFDMRLLQESFADATSKIVGAQESRSKLEEELSSKLDELAQVKKLLTDVREELTESTNSIQEMEIDLVALKESKSTLTKENVMLTDKIQQLEVEKNNIQGELEEKTYLVESLDQELLELSSLVEQKIGEAVGGLNQELHLVVKERDQLNAELLVVTEQLEMAQSLADEREIVATEARQVAEVSKAQAEEKEEEIKVLERSVGELESIVNALENQVAVIKREAQMHRLMREDLETEVQSLKYEISLRSGSTEMKLTDGETVLHLKEEVSRLSEDCSEKDAQIHAYKNHISDLMAASSKQGVQYRQKITELETLLEQLKSAKPKGSSSPFKCIGLGLSQQINSEIDEELSAARSRIGELENIAANRQREVFMLNARLAEAESMTHDVVRDLLGVKMDIASYASMHAYQDASSIKAEEEISRLRKQVEAYIEERESCLEEINHRQGDIVAIRAATEKLRQREETLATENENLKDELNDFKKHQTELENEVLKLSGQQNLQQRIHHHAKIKEENNCLKMKNEELSTKLRHMEARLQRITDELARCRNTEGDIPDDEDLQSS